MTDSVPSRNKSRAQILFQEAPCDIQELVKRLIAKERLVQHMEGGRRMLPGANGQGIYQALLEQMKMGVK